MADALVQITLAIFRFLRPSRWYLENPRNGMLKDRPYMQGIPFVDLDYCQFIDWGYQKPTRIWGSADVQCLPPRKCNPKVCPFVVTRPDGTHGHYAHLGANHMLASPQEKGRVPAGLVRYLLGVPEPVVVAKISRVLDAMQLVSLPWLDDVDAYPPGRGRS